MPEIQQGALLIAALLLAGCTSTDEKARALANLAKNCAESGGTATIHAEIGSWAHRVVVTCQLPPGVVFDDE